MTWPLFQNAHLQTVVATGFRKPPSGDLSVTYVREHVAVPDGGELSLDWDDRVVVADAAGSLMSPIGTAASAAFDPHVPSRDDVVLVQGAVGIRPDVPTVVLLHGLTGGSQEKCVVCCAGVVKL